jgi:hypothetical protein
MLILGFCFFLLLALDGENVIRDGQVNILCLQARQFW